MFRKYERNTNWSQTLESTLSESTTNNIIKDEQNILVRQERIEDVNATRIFTNSTFKTYKY